MSLSYASFPAYLKKMKELYCQISMFQYSHILKFSSVCVYVCMRACGLTIYTAQIGPFCHFLYDAKKQTILCTQGANLSPKTKCNFGKASGMCSALRELGITGLVCVIQWSKCEQRFIAKFTISKRVTINLSTGEIRIKHMCP